MVGMEQVVATDVPKFSLVAWHETKKNSVVAQ